MISKKIFVLAAAASVLAGCAALVSVSDQEVVATLKDSFSERSIAKLDRLDQSELQRSCSEYARSELPPQLREKLQQAALDSVKYPADNKYLGDWKQGEKVAQNGRGMQFTDDANTVNGGNCYACHQIDKKEISYGNIGPSLWNYGKLRGNSEPIIKYTWAKVWNSHSFNACSQMPRYGGANILTESQLKDVMALLLDPASPVNQ